MKRNNTTFAVTIGVYKADTVTVTFKCTFVENDNNLLLSSTGPQYGTVCHLLCYLTLSN